LKTKKNEKGLKTNFLISSEIAIIIQIAGFYAKGGGDNPKGKETRQTFCEL
jgi:hypothetical protein